MGPDGLLYLFCLIALAFVVGMAAHQLQMFRFGVRPVPFDGFGKGITAIVIFFLICILLGLPG